MRDTGAAAAARSKAGTAPVAPPDPHSAGAPRGEAQRRVRGPARGGDAAPRLRAALASLPDAGGTLVLGPGLFELRAPVWLRSGVSVFGSGVGRTRVRGAGIFRIGSARDVEIAGLSFEGVDARAPTPCIDVSDAARVAVRGCAFRRAGSPDARGRRLAVRARRVVGLHVARCTSERSELDLSGEGGARDVRVERCWLAKPRERAVVVGLAGDGATLERVVVEDCVVLDATGGAIAVGPDGARPPAASALRDVAIRRCRIQGRSGSGPWVGIEVRSAARGADLAIDDVVIAGAPRSPEATVPDREATGIAIARGGPRAPLQDAVFRRVRVSHVAGPGIAFGADVRGLRLEDCTLTATGGLALPGESGPRLGLVIDVDWSDARVGGASRP